MIGLGMIAALYALFVLWLFRGGRTPKSRLFAVFNSVIVLFPLFGISAGWIFTEMGRQPWIVFGLMTTAAGVSPIVTNFQVWTSLIGFTLLYAVLAIVEVGLIIRTVRQGPPEAVADPFVDRELDAPLTISY
jgi:cytochrome d ubiquinol oxidase subunit I